MLVSELKDKCRYPWDPVFLDINNELCAITSIDGNDIYVVNYQEPMFACEILEELEGKFGELEIVQ